MAAGIAFSVVGKLAEYTVDPVFCQINYLFFYNRNIQNLRDIVEDLENRRDDVKQRVVAAERNAEIIGEHVSAWLGNVDELKENANEVLKGVASSEMRCLFNRCPNLKSRYILSRKSAKMTIEADKLKMEGTFERLSSLPQPVQVLNLTSHEGFKTRLSIKKKIKKALKDNDIGIIGICGMPGIGKTTMTREIVNEVKVEKLFEEVAFAVVSKNPDINKIQDKLAKVLGLKIKEKTTSARAGLRQRLAGNDGKSILVILDDVWNEIDLGSIGIPSPHDRKGLKIMFTTRIEETCSKMGAQRKFKIKVLDKEEGWQLFKDTAGISDDETSVELVSTAKNVADECGRLPLALVVAGGALKSKAVHRWRDALRELHRSATNLEGMEKVVHNSIRLSYNNLASNEEQGLLLLCSLSAEGESIPIENLVSYARGLKLFKNTEKLYETRDRAKTITNKLKGCYLLQPGEEEDEVKLHDVIRDFCLHMAYEDKGGFLVNHAGLIEWPEHDADESWSAISITFDKLGQLPGGLKYHNVKLLRVICREMGECIISEDFFKDMEELRVLELEGMYIQIPSSIELLTGLRTLCLNNCKIHSQLSMIGSLKKLEILSFYHSSIGDYFPIELVNLSNLKSLILSNGDLAYLIDAANSIPRGTFGKLESLELKGLPNLVEICNGNLPRVVFKPPLFLNLLIVKMYDCDSIRSLFWESVAKCLVNLQSLDIYKCAMLEEVVSTEAQENEVTILEFPKLKKISFENLRRFKSFTTQANSSDDSQTLFNQVYLPNMEELIVDRLDCLVKLLGKEMLITFGKLESLELKGLPNLVEIGNGDLQRGDFKPPLSFNLKTVKMYDCDAIRSLFRESVAKCLVNLQSLDIYKCAMLEEVVSTDAQENEVTITGKMLEFPKLKKISFENLRRFKSFTTQANSSDDSQTLFNQVYLPNMEELTVDRLDCLVKLLGKEMLITFGKLESLELKGLPNLVEIGNGDLQRGDFKPPLSFNLKTVKMYDCDAIRSLFRESVAKCLVNLQSLDIYKCAMLEEVVSTDAQENEVTITGKMLEFPKLKKISFENLRRFKSFTTQANSSDDSQTLFNQVYFPNMEELTVDRLDCLVKLLGKEMLITFGKLESLELKGLPNLVEIGNGDLPRGDFKPPLSFNLKTVKMYDCDAIRSLFLESVAKCLVNLQSLDIYKCAMLEEVVSTDAQENEVTITCKMLEFPKLKKIIFENLRRFKSFTTQANSSDDSQTLFNQVYFPNMEELTVDRLDCLVKLLGKEMLITFGKLESLELKGLPNLVEIGNGDLQRGDFKPPLSFNLKTVKMYDCDAIRSLFRESVAKCLVNLQSLDIYKCAMLEEVVSTDAQENEVTITGKMLEFPKLKKIIFENLRRFKSFTTQANSSDDSQTLFNQVYFPNMEELTVDRLDCLVKLLGKEMLITFGKLESLELKGLPNLVEIGNGDLPRGVFEPPWSFNLETVKMYDCDAIRSLFRESVAKCLVNLQSLDIYKCAMLEEVVSTDAQENEVTITCKMLEFPKLKKISFENLRRFKSFSSQANSSDDGQTLFNQVNFPNIEELNVRELDCIVKLLGKEMPIKSLHKLKQMVVRRCYKLLTIVESDSIQLLQNLKDLDVRKCDALEVLFDFEGIKVTNDDAEISVLGRLRSLSLDSLPQLVHITRMVPKGICVFQNLTELTVLHCKRLRYLFSPSMVISLAALENLSIDSCKALEEIIGREEKEEENTSETRNIVMDANTPSNLHHFTQVVSMDAKRNEVIEMLEFPKLNKLMLRNLISFKRFRSESNNDGILRTLFNQVTLPNMENLTSIVVERCGIFKYLFLPSMANSLVALRVLEVSNCKSIKAIVGKEEEEEEEEEGTSEIKIVEVMKISIAFPKLDRLLLKNLSSIEMFCSQNCELVFPLLKDLTLENCPMMAKLSPWLVSAPKLDISNDGLETRLSIKKKIRKALKDKVIGIIGVYGMPGIGKTTMAEEIVNEVKVEKLFDKVAFVVVSNNPDINKIKDQLAEVLGPKIKEKRTSARAGQLRQRLAGNDEKSILVILDDVWNEIDLGSIGIPSPHDRKGLKIMFTTRIEETCSKMGAQRKFKIEVLDDKEGWQLFKDTAGISDDETDVDLVSMAKNVADECRGLPLALVVVGKALKGNKTVDEWKDARQQLQRSSATNLEGMDNIVYKSIRLSYNYLVSNEERGLLLLCSLFAEDESIPIENLVRYARGLKLFKGTETLYETIDRSYSIVDNLKSSNLLQPGKKKDEVKLHDVIRDFCLHMAYEDKRGYLVNHAGLKEWPEDDADESCNAISITLDKSGQLPGGLKYQNVELLRVICRELGECTISEEFFKDMKELRVLELEGMYIQIPSSIQLLTGLQTLYLIDCKIHSQLSMIGSLKKLEVLSFYHSYFGDYFPIEFELANLSNLRSLDLRFRVLSYPLLPGVLSGMKELEELYLGRYIPIEGEDQRCIIEELCSLTSLRTFQISTHDTQILVQIFTELCLENLKRFHIDEVKVLRNSELDGDGFFKLRTPTLSRSDFKYLIDAANSIPRGTFGKLESLELKGLPNLVEIGNGDLPRGVFKPPLSFNIQTVKMYDCDAIRSLFRESVAKCLVNLQSLDIYKCAMLEEVVSTDAQENEVTITCKMLEFPKLKKISFENLRRFKSFTTQANSSDDSQTLFNQVYFPNMEELTVDRLDCLVKLLGKEMLITFGKLESLELKGLTNLVEIGNGDLPRGDFKPPLSFNLKTVKMYDCDAIRSLFRESVAKCLVNLQSLDIYKCAMLEEVVSTDAQENEVTITCKMLEFPKLKKIIFENLRRFKSFTTQANSSDDSQTLFNQVYFPNMEELTVDRLDCLVKLLGKEMLITSLDKLTDMEVSDCAKLQSIAESDSIQLLKNLKVLNVVRCNALKVLFDFEGIKDAKINMLGQLTRLWMFSLPKLVNITRMVPKGIRVFQNLTKLVVLNCESLRYLFSPSMANSLVALRVLHVSDCKSIEEIVGKEEEEGTSEDKIIEGKEEEEGTSQDKIVEGKKTRIVFHELCNLLLVNLPSIQNFCSQNSELVFPSMTTLIVRRCPKMKKFSPQPMNAPKLSKFERECVILPPDLLDVAGN